MAEFEPKVRLEGPCLSERCHLISDGSWLCLTLNFKVVLELIVSFFVAHYEDVGDVAKEVDVRKYAAEVSKKVK